MEDMARLAHVEQCVNDVEKYGQILRDLLNLINNILENPDNNELRCVPQEILTLTYRYYALNDYLKSIGFQVHGSRLIYPFKPSLIRLRTSKEALEKKIHYCFGPSLMQKLTPTKIIKLDKKESIVPCNVLKTKNELLLKFQSLFNMVLKYEDEELQELARKDIPITTLQLAAIKRMREHQKKIKEGDIKAKDMPFEMAMLMEVVAWFKYSFFSWVDNPECTKCNEETTYVYSTTLAIDSELCKVEMYECGVCGTSVCFPRYSDVRTVLGTRRGRCGEWANCFALVTRALGYETRYVYDTTDHVWCEVYDYEEGAWLHVDPCEGRVGAPLLYERGWNKRLAYVLAVSCDDLQDVTWRYTTHHSQVLKRRNLCTEKELIDSMVVMREHRQHQLSEARRRYLAKRTAMELVQLMLERSPTDMEIHGRISGSQQWRVNRGETKAAGHVFEMSREGSYSLVYSAASDQYTLTRADGSELIESWANGVYESEKVDRKVEKDWKMAYLARQEGESGAGVVSWKMRSSSNLLIFKRLEIKLKSQLYEDATIQWTLHFDGEPVTADLGEVPAVFVRDFTEVVVRARLGGGRGTEAWQHAQLFRQPLGDSAGGLHVSLTLAHK